MMFEPTRQAGLDRLQRFLPRAGRDYAASRNFDHGGENRENTSTLSPYLRHRLLTEREVIAPVLERHGPNASFKFVQEVFWRSYWKGWLETHPDVWQRYRTELAALHRDMPSGLRKTYDEACEGRSGIDGFDHWARELVESGYLHNHARMWFASIWIFTLRLPWELGAEFFLRHLIDGDPASNTLSWRWVAGLQTKGKTYLATRDNISRYTNGRFAPAGLAARAQPLDEPPLAAARPLPPTDALPKNEDVALLLCEDDLGIETLDLDAERVRAVAAVSFAERRSASSASPEVLAFTSGAMADTLARSQSVFPVAASGGVLQPAGVADWLQSLRVRTLVMPYCPIGPAADEIAELSAQIEQQGVKLLTQRRSWDSHAWPYASKGFFQLGKKIPDILQAEGLAS